MRRAAVLLTLSLVAAVVFPGVAAARHAGPFPDVIGLPDGFQPEGIAVGPGDRFYVGSIPTGAIYAGRLSTGHGAILVPARQGRAAIGLAHDRRGDRLFVAGGPTGQAYVYDARTGRALRTYTLTTRASFVNDVIVTRRAAYLTDSVNQVLYRIAIARNGRLGAATTIPLTGDLAYEPGFNVNGIEASPDGRTLFLVQSNTGMLFTADARTGVTRRIDLGGADVTNGDGLLLDGPILYVVQNRDNRIAVVRLSSDRRRGRIVALLRDGDFDVPTTVAEFGRRLYAVNARFGTDPTPTTDYDVVAVRKYPPRPRRWFPFGVGPT